MTRPLPIPLVPPGVRNVLFDHAVYTVKVDGPGRLHVRPAGRGKVGIELFGTTEDSALKVIRKRVGLHYDGSALSVGRIDVNSGLLGAIDAPPAALTGNVSSLDGSLRLLRLGAVGPRARIEVGANLDRFEAGSIALGPTGLIHVAGQLGTLDVAGRVDLDGGSLLADQGLVGAVNVGALRIAGGGRLASGGVLGALRVASDATITDGASLASRMSLQGLEIGGTLEVGAGGRIDVGQDLNGLVRIGNDLRLTGGQIVVAGDVLNDFTVGRDVLASGGGSLSIGRNLDGRLMIGDDLQVDSGTIQVGRDVAGVVGVAGNAQLRAGGVVSVGRDLAGLAITGDLDTSGGGLVRVGGNLDRLEVSGAIIGKGTPGAPDISVGLDLNNLVVLGIVPGAGSVNRVDLDIGKNLVGIDVRHGFFFSFVTAGVLIDGGTTPPGGNIGPDGPVAVLDTEIRAGAQIRNLLIAGDVKSDQVTNPGGRPTRIVAGLDRAGEYRSGGNIDNFQITGALIDAVLAASVAPEGGDGTLTQECSDIPGDGTYDAPAGTLAIGTIGNVGTIPHFAPGSYDEFGRLLGYFYDTALDPIVDDCILPGAINASFAPVPLSVNAPPSTPIPLPTRSTVLGGVINTASHAGTFDFAGIFAADTRGVLVGTV
jgi:hypothetical protein